VGYHAASAVPFHRTGPLQFRGDFFNILNHPNFGSPTNYLSSPQFGQARQMLNDYLGNAATNVTLEVTENGTGGDRQNVSLPGGLFYADSIGQILQTEFNSRVWWDLRNGHGYVDKPDPAFYGWRTNANGSVLSDGGIIYGLGGPRSIQLALKLQF